MTPADRAIVAAAEERDRALSDLDNAGAAARWLGIADRRELLRIVGQLMFAAERYRDALEICAAADSPPGVESAVTINRRNIARHALRAAEDLADDAAATEATKGRWGG